MSDQHQLYGFIYRESLPKPAAVTGLVRPGDYLVDESGFYLTDQDGNRLVGGRLNSWSPWLGDALTDESGNYLMDESGNRLVA